MENSIAILVWMFEKIGFYICVDQYLENIKLN